jgi:hypothetical protein
VGHVHDQALVTAARGRSQVRVREVHVHGLHVADGARDLRLELQRDRLLRLDPEAQHVRRELAALVLKIVVRDALELDGDLRNARGRPFAGPDVERDPGPAPVVEDELDGRVRRGLGVRRDVLLLPVARNRLPFDDSRSVLAAHRPVVRRLFRERPDRLQDLDLLGAHRVRLEFHGGLHRRQAEELEQVVLEHVAQDAGLLVVAGPVADADRFAHRDLDVVHVALVPERLEDPVRETEDEDVLNRLLREVVVDPVDLLFVEDAPQGPVQRPGGLEVVAERLFDDDPRPAVLGPGEPLVPQEFDDLRVGVRRRRQVEDPIPLPPPLPLDLLQGRSE